MSVSRDVYELQARLCQVFASAKRIEILYALNSHGEMTPGKIADEVDVSLPNLSQHLSLMKQQGLVESRKEGLNMHYRLSSDLVVEVLSQVRRVLAEQITRQNALLEHV